ncbi:4-diphosphocytidyl-2C-methyl-D-erythritol synthase [Thiobacillus denitrificans ATCC 25259]|uniref:2-C-methyl-D-erythritol 4-phosphate cytidylyltransferase n=1 Tax=Thiobacillus denitrificans (strain ATCC 25259 / T1) TaxID=292415 RepID=ISPD_THIDA|nr:2-C-methyl-D-erythritol 4-phosphate cytidylyltransferase [Thiobacillus denitrificans]Q3SK38.1 RecName: Full=2-C-methyl-D-erythritol 4-phosphate cytidylyltransferase; AltName: Full=4-diphosphocytidyl-2C-methyl-D-erythritol synthase; AltName: Full=MEP cytidylyltransferase; Short=MCT [Thiobacillus denitrificans ATCC 25259]AAZ96956.1 4-diphosphocytidyl-2C-methyl-D-erythritol synthase [Thiobacillus denitrificans ATCC 25259]
MKFYALIPAAGSGSRMGGAIEKQYMDVNSVPMIAHAMMVLAREPRIARIFVVLSPTDKRWNNYEWQGWEERIEVLRCGGGTRAETVLNALDAIAEVCDPADWVLVHDAARPCLPDEMLGKLLDEVADDPVGGLLAVPVADTLKRAAGDTSSGTRVEATVPRAGLWQAQTPQMFRHGTLTEALRAAGSDMTDEASAIEKLGLQPQLVESDSRNLKVTYPQDLELASLILGKMNA